MTMDARESRSVETVSTKTSRRGGRNTKPSKQASKSSFLIQRYLPLDPLYDEYEEEEELVRPEMVGNVFFAMIARLAEIMTLINELAATPPAKQDDPTKRKKSSADPAAMTGEDLQHEKTQLVDSLLREIDQEEFNTKKKIRTEEEQMEIRRVQLAKSSLRLEDRRKHFHDLALKKYEQQEWERYMTCDGLPDPAVVQDMNRYLYLWSLTDSTASMDTLPEQCEIAIHLIKKMNEILETSLKATPSYLAVCKEVRQSFRDQLQRWINLASYCLLRQIDRDMERVDLKNASYVRELAPVVLCFWALIKLPISIKPMLEKDKKPFEVDFKEVGLAVKMPQDLDIYCTAMRVLWYGYDHYSDQVSTYEMPKLTGNNLENVPNHLQGKLAMSMDLWQWNIQEFEKLTRIRDEQSEDREKRLKEKRRLIEKILKPPQEPKDKKKKKPKKEESTSAIVIPDTSGSALATPESIVLAEEEEIKKERRRVLFTRCKKTEINLRKYAILGGLYQIDLIRQPPQPKDMRRDIFLTTLQLPKELEYVEFCRPYKAPPPIPDSERTPEAVEAEIKALETAMDKLALVTLKLPDSVMWFEPPLVAHWLDDQKIWSTEDVHDIKYNEEKQTMTFRTGRLGLHGLAGYRFVNLPFQSWELKPETGRKAQGGVILSITGAIIQLEFLIREELVSLHSIAGGSSTALQDLIGQFMELRVLINKMKAAGCDVFPELDSASYLKGVALKHPVAARHLEGCMGLLCTGYVFSWSRWNATRPYREIVLQIKEIHGCVAKERPTEIILVTPFRTMVVKCSEVSAEFSDKDADKGKKFYSDLYHYAIHNAGIKTRLCMKDVSYKLSETLTKVLQATNILNMSA